MAQSKRKSDSDQDREEEINLQRDKAKRKHPGVEKPIVQVGNISNIPGNVQVAGGDINTNITYEEATAAKTEKEFALYELADLQTAILEKVDFLKTKSIKQVESGKSLHPGALDINESNSLLGRDEFLRQISFRLMSEHSVFVSGRGGIGKTSLLQAGLVPVLLKQGHLPVLVSLSREPLVLAIKRSLLTSVSTTTYLRSLNLAKFLEHVTKFIPENSRLLMLLDNYENVMESTSEEELRAFEVEWEHTRNNPKLGWLFCIDSGFTTRLASFQPQKFLEVPLLDRETATHAIRQSGLKIEDAYLQEILNELEHHREPIQGARINPSELQIVLKPLVEGDASQPPSEIYESKGRVNGILEEFLVDAIKNNFLPAERPIVWQILTFLKETYGTPVSTAWIDGKLRMHGFETQNLPQLLKDLRIRRIISTKEEKYELANVNLMRGVWRWLDQQTLLNTARAESLEQLDRIRASALRGLLGGAIGLGTFRWIVGGSLLDFDLDTVIFLTLVHALLGGLMGLLLTLLIDVFITRHRSGRLLRRYLFCAGTGVITFGFGLGLYVYLTAIGEDKLLRFIFSSLVGGAWGLPAGLGIAWTLSSTHVHPWKLPATALASGFVLFLFNFLIPVLTPETSLNILVGGFWFPFVTIAAILFRKRDDSDSMLSEAR